MIYNHKTYNGYFEELVYQNLIDLMMSIMSNYKTYNAYIKLLMYQN